MHNYSISTAMPLKYATGWEKLEIQVSPIE